MSDTPIQPAQEQPLKEISAEDCLKILSRECIKVEEYKDYYIEGARKDEYRVVLKDVKVIGNLSINKTHLKGFELNNCETDAIFIRESSISGITIKNSHVMNFQIDTNSTIGNFWFFNSSTNGVLLSSSELTVFKVYENSSIGGVRMRNTSKINQLDIQNSCIFNRISFTDNSTIDFWKIVDSFTDDILLYNTGNIKLEISNSTLGVLKYYGDTSKSRELIIKDNSHLAGLVMEKAAINTAIVTNGVIIREIEFLYLNIESKRILFQGCQIGTIRLNIDKPYQITIKDIFNSYVRSEIDNIEFIGSVFPSHALMQVSQTFVNGLYFDSFLNYGTIVLSGIRPTNDYTSYKTDSNGNAIRLKEGLCKKEYEQHIAPKASIIKIYDSDLGDTQFIGCDLVSFDKFEFRNSKMAKVFLADTTLPHRSRINTSSDTNESEQKRLALSQFKKIYEGQGDTVRASEFRAEEMEVYREQLKKKKKAKNRNSELFVLWLNRNSNYYGNNWFQATLVTLGVTWLFYTVYCWVIGYRFGSDWNKFFELFSYSFEFLNPIRRHSTLAEEHDITPLARIVDYISRIFIAYFVYQTVAAFRKFGRKSA